MRPTAARRTAGGGRANRFHTRFPRVGFNVPWKTMSRIAVACAATGMSSSDESKLFRFTLRHSIFLASIIGLIVLVYSYVIPGAVF